MLINNKFILSLLFAGACAFAIPTPLLAKGDWQGKDWKNKGWHGHHHGNKHHQGNRGNKNWDRKKDIDRMTLFQQGDGTWVAKLGNKDIEFRAVFPIYPQFTSKGKSGTEFEVIQDQASYTLLVYKDLKAAKAEFNAKSNQELALALANAERFAPIVAGSWTYRNDLIFQQGPSKNSSFEVYDFLTRGTLGAQSYLIRMVKVIITPNSAYVVADSHYTANKTEADEAAQLIQDEDNPEILRLSDTPFIDRTVFYLPSGNEDEDTE